MSMRVYTPDDEKSFGHRMSYINQLLGIFLPLDKNYKTFYGYAGHFVNRTRENNLLPAHITKKLSSVIF